MNRPIHCTGLALVGLGAIASGAIGAEPAPAPTSMSALSLPPLEQPVSSSPTIPAPPLAELATELPMSDVPTSHWSYTAVRDVITAYNCLSGYPDGTFQGEEALTRYEFAAAVNTCLDGLIRLVEADRNVNLGELLEELTGLREALGDLEEDGDDLEP